MRLSYSWYLIGWWLVIPMLLCTGLIFCMIKWRVRAMSALALLSAVIAIAVALLLPLSWDTYHHVMVNWGKPLARGQYQNSNVELASVHGGIKLGVETISGIPSPTIQPARFIVERGAIGSYRGYYPVYSPSFEDIRDFHLTGYGF